LVPGTDLKRRHHPLVAIGELNTEVERHRTKDLVVGDQDPDLVGGAWCVVCGGWSVVGGGWWVD